jgi:hypothetical protein
MKLEFSYQIFNVSSNTKFHENPCLGAEFFHADGRTDAFRDFASAPNKLKLFFIIRV